jgi:hypothetical protein
MNSFTVIEIRLQTNQRCKTTGGIACIKNLTVKSLSEWINLTINIYHSEALWIWMADWSAQEYEK